MDKAIKDKSIHEIVFFEPNTAMHAKLRENAAQAGKPDPGNRMQGL